MAKNRPVARVLESLLAVKELSMDATSSVGFKLAEGRLPDGSTFAVTANLSRQQVILERTGRATRIVELKDLVSTMLVAGEGS